MITDKEYNKAKLIIEQYIKQLTTKVTEANRLVVKSPLTELMRNYVPIRTKNVLNTMELYNITIHEFAEKNISVSELLTYRNMGKKSIEDLNKVLLLYGYTPLKKK